MVRIANPPVNLLLSVYMILKFEYFTFVMVKHKKRTVLCNCSCVFYIHIDNVHLFLTCFLSFASVFVLYLQASVCVVELNTLRYSTLCLKAASA